MSKTLRWLSRGGHSAIIPHKLTAVVVLPHPPLWLMIPITLASMSSALGQKGADTFLACRKPGDSNRFWNYRQESKILQARIFLFKAFQAEKIA
jgi:hypothetical protein